MKSRIETLNYGRIATMMKSVGWRWFDTPKGRTPTTKEIEAKIRMLIARVQKMDVGGSIYGGGFLVEKLDEEDSPKGTIQVSFIGDRGWLYPTR